MLRHNAYQRILHNADIFAAVPTHEETARPSVAAGFRLIICVILSATAFGTRTPLTLVGLTVVNLICVALFKANVNVLWREVTKIFIFQSIMIVGLYVIRFGFEGAWPGFKTSWQLLLAFLPGLIFWQSTPHPQIIRMLNRIMPDRLAFVLATSLRFIPLVIGEVRSIYEVQMLRGARILPGDLVRPWHWGDLIHCLLVPVIVRMLMLAGEIARAARIREFGHSDRRTCWPGR